MEGSHMNEQPCSVFWGKRERVAVPIRNGKHPSEIVEVGVTHECVLTIDHARYHECTCGDTFTTGAQ